MAATSPIAPAIAVEGLLIQVGNAASPETMQTIANATDLSLPIMTAVVDVTNVSDSWRRRIPTLHDMGKIAFKIFWVMEEVTHRNSINGGAVGAGLRYLMVNSLGRDFQFVYPDNPPPNSSTDAFFAYVTGFAITGKVGGVFEASIELSNSGAPSLV
jgi:hypothetical protein